MSLNTMLNESLGPLEGISSAFDLVSRTLDKLHPGLGVRNTLPWRLDYGGVKDRDLED